MTKPRKAVSQWLFNTLAGTFVEDATLYVGAAEVQATGVLSMTGDVESGTLNPAGYSLTDGRVYPLATKEDVKTPYVVYDNIETLYERTKDGNEPATVTARVLCVDKGCSAVEALADAVEDKMSDAFIPALNSECVVTARRSDYDAATGEFLEEIRIRIDL